MLMFSASLQASDFDLAPAPHYVEQRRQNLQIPSPVKVRVRLTQPNLSVGREILAKGFPAAQFIQDQHNADVIPWDYSTPRDSTIDLKFLDRQLFGESPLRGRSYVLRSVGGAVWVGGGGTVGVICGAVTPAQLLRKTGNAVEVPGVYIRDYPDFEFRAAGDWLLNAEVNRWSLDRGQGLADLLAWRARRSIAPPVTRSMPR